MKALNDKIYFELLDDSEQPKKSTFRPNMDMLKYAKVLDVGQNTKWVKQNDIITLYYMSIVILKNNEGFCSEREVLLSNGIPPERKVLISHLSRETLSNFNKASVLESNSEDISKGDIIFYKQGSSHLLPDNTEIINENQIYYSNNKG